MPLIWNPTGHLDIATDPSDLPSVSSGPSSEASDAFQRLKNMRTDRSGMAIVRDGSSKLNSTALETPVRLIVEQSADRYVFAGSQLYKNEVSIETGLTSSQWSAIKYNSFNSTDEEIFALNGTDRKRVSGSDVEEWGIEAPTVAPVVIGVDRGAVTFDWELDEITVNSDILYQFTIETGDFVHTFGWEAAFLGSEDAYPDDTFVATWSFERFNITDKFKIKYTYARQDEDTVLSESNGSPETVVGVDLLNAWNVQWPASPDSQVTHVRIYRTLANGSLFLFDSSAPIFTPNRPSGGRDKTITDTDGELGEGIPVDHDRPPVTGTIAIGPDFDGTTFILADNNLFPSKAKQPEYYPVDNAIEISPIQEPLIAGTFWNGSAYVGTKSDIHQIQGSSSTTFFPYKLSAQTGTQSPLAFLGIMGHGIFHLGPDGIYLYNGEVDRNIMEERFEPIFRGVAANGMPGLDLNRLAEDWLVHWDNKLYFGYVGLDTENTSILVISLSTNKVRYYDYGLNFQAAAIDITNRRILAATSTGLIWHLEDTTVARDDALDVDWELQSKDFTLQTRPHFPRWAKYDIDSSRATEVIGKIILDDVLHQSHAITAAQSRTVRRRLIGPGNGQRASIQISGSGPATAYLAEME